MGEFSPPPPPLLFSEPPSFCTDLKYFKQALVLLHYYKNSPPISKFWIRVCKFPLTTESHPRPGVTKLGHDDSVHWIIVSKPILTAAVNDTAFHAFQNIPGKQQKGFAALVKNSTLTISPSHAPARNLSGATVPRRYYAIKARSIIISNIDFFLKILPLKDDELVMPEI